VVDYINIFFTSAYLSSRSFLHQSIKERPNIRDINLRKIMDPELEAYEQMGEQDAFNYDGIILRRSDPDDCD